MPSNSSSSSGKENSCDLEDLRSRLSCLEAGDPLDYNELLRELEESELDFEARTIYHDSAGFLERWFLDGDEVAVIDGLGGQVLVRNTPGVTL